MNHSWDEGAKAVSWLAGVGTTALRSSTMNSRISRQEVHRNSISEMPSPPGSLSMNTTRPRRSRLPAKGAGLTLCDSHGSTSSSSGTMASRTSMAIWGTLPQQTHGGGTGSRSTLPSAWRRSSTHTTPAPISAGRTAGILDMLFWASQICSQSHEVFPSSIPSTSPGPSG